MSCLWSEGVSKRRCCEVTPHAKKGNQNGKTTQENGTWNVMGIDLRPPCASPRHVSDARGRPAGAGPREAGHADPEGYATLPSPPGNEGEVAPSAGRRS